MQVCRIRIHYAYGKIDRQHYEMVVLIELQELVQSGNISIMGRKLHQDFEEYLMSKEQSPREAPQ